MPISNTLPLVGSNVTPLAPVPSSLSPFHVLCGMNVSVLATPAKVVANEAAAPVVPAPKVNAALKRQEINAGGLTSLLTLGGAGLGAAYGAAKGSKLAPSISNIPSGGFSPDISTRLPSFEFKTF